MPPHPGDVVLTRFPGAKDTKLRPAVVISTDLYHQTRPDLIVAMCSAQVAKATKPTDHVLQDWQVAGLSKPTAVRINLATPERWEVYATLGRLSDRDWQEVQARLRLALAVI